MEIRSISKLKTYTYCNLGDQLLVFYENSPTYELGKITNFGFAAEKRLHSAHEFCHEQIYPIWIDNEHVLVRCVLDGRVIIENISGIYWNLKIELPGKTSSILGAWRNKLLTNHGHALELYMHDGYWKYSSKEVITLDIYEEIQDLAVLSDDIVVVEKDTGFHVLQWNSSKEHFDSVIGEDFDALFCSAAFLHPYVFVLTEKKGSEDDEDFDKYLLKLDLEQPDNYGEPFVQDPSLRNFQVWKNFVCTLHQTPEASNFTLKLWKPNGECYFTWVCFSASPGADYEKIQVSQNYLLISSSLPDKGVTYIMTLNLAWCIQKVLWLGWSKNADSPLSKLPKDILKYIIDIIGCEAATSCRMHDMPAKKKQLTLGNMIKRARVS